MTTNPSHSRNTTVDSMTVSMAAKGVTPVFTRSFLRVIIAASLSVLVGLARRRGMRGAPVMAYGSRYAGKPHSSAQTVTAPAQIDGERRRTPPRRTQRPAQPPCMTAPPLSNARLSDHTRDPRSAMLQIYVERHRAMIASHDVGVDGCIPHGIAQRIAHQEIVDAPSCVVLARVEAIAPPGVSTRLIGM